MGSTTQTTTIMVHLRLTPYIGSWMMSIFTGWACMAIPEWDGWYIPMEDMGCIHMLQITEEDCDHYCLDNSHSWLLVGEDPHFDQLFA